MPKAIHESDIDLSHFQHGYIDLWIMRGNKYELYSDGHAVLILPQEGFIDIGGQFYGD